MEQVFLALPERDDFMFVMSGAGFLEPIDLALDVHVLPVISQPLESSDAVCHVCRSPSVSADALDKLGLSFT